MGKRATIKLGASFVVPLGINYANVKPEFSMEKEIYGEDADEFDRRLKRFEDEFKDHLIDYFNSIVVLGESLVIQVTGDTKSHKSKKSHRSMDED